VARKVGVGVGVDGGEAQAGSTNRVLSALATKRRGTRTANTFDRV
jgi:hypothetical protein